jgi:hypothetical protein
VDAYNAAFNALAIDTKWNDEALQTAYIKGLNEKVARVISSGENPPKTLADWQTRAATYSITQGHFDKQNPVYPDSFQYDNQKASSYIQNRPDSYRPRRDLHSPYAVSSAEDMGAAMDLDALRTGRRFNKLTEEERNRYRREGRCFRCRQKGHMAIKCPLNQQGRTNMKIVRNRTVSVAEQVQELISGANEDDKAEILMAVHGSIKDDKDFA